MTSFSSTLFNKVVDKIAPGVLTGLIANDQQLCQLNLSGSVKMTMFGIESQSKSWLDMIEIFDLPAFSSSPWASVMLRQRNLSLRQMGHVSMLTSSFGSNPISNEGRARTPVLNLKAINVQTGVAELALSAAIMAQYTPEISLRQGEPAGTVLPAVANQTTPSLSDFASFRLYREAADSPMYGLCNDMLHTFSYNVALGYPVIIATTTAGTFHNWEAAPILPSMLANIVDGTPITGATYDDLYIAATFKALTGLSCPGVKYCYFLFRGYQSDSPVFVHIGGTSTDITAGSAVVAIPIMDDGSKTVTCYAGDRVNEYLFELSDRRYSDAPSSGSSLHVSQYWMNLLYPDGYKDTLGNLKPWSSVPVLGHETGLGLGSFFLPLMSLPLDEQHYICGEPVTRMVDYDDGSGGIISVKEIDLPVRVVAAKVTPDWYKQYYQTGFGLYTPRDSNIQANHLELWKAVDWVSMGVVIDASNSTINPDIVFSTDLAIAYATARERACKTNDWLDQNFIEGVTYKEVRDRIIAKPTRNGFYSINGLTAEESFANVPLEINWTTTNTVPNQFVREEGGVEETLEANVVNAELMLTEFSDILEYTPDAYQMMITILNMGTGDIEALNTARAEARSPYLNEYQALRGYPMKDQYFAPQQALSRSGYPTYRYMQEPFKATMVMNCYAQLDKMGDNIVKILKSFTDDVVIQKVLSK